MYGRGGAVPRLEEMLGPDIGGVHVSGMVGGPEFAPSRGDSDPGESRLGSAEDPYSSCTVTEIYSQGSCFFVQRAQGFFGGCSVVIHLQMLFSRRRLMA